MNQNSKDVQVFLEAYAVGNASLSDSPTYALVVANRVFTAQLCRLQKLCTEQDLTEVRISYAPEMWGPNGIEEEMRMTCPELVVTKSSFWFADRGRHIEAEVETRQLCIRHFFEAIEAADGPIYLGTEPQAIEEAVRLDTEEEEAANVTEAFR